MPIYKNQTCFIKCLFNLNLNNNAPNLADIALFSILLWSYNELRTLR